MQPDDARHGTSAGHSAHRRANQTPCEPCRTAKARADKRRRVLGNELTPLGPEAWDIIQTTPRHLLIATSGVSECAIRNIVNKQGNINVRPTTRQRILDARVVTEIGLSRRLQALAALGWSAREIARRSGVNVDNIIKLRLGASHRKYVRREVREGVIPVYEELQMRTPPATKWAKATRRLATNRGWVPPLAWDDIDAPDATPQGAGASTVDRADTLRDIDAWGGNATDAARVLGIDRKSLQKWAAASGHAELYRRLAAREAMRGNQFTEGAA